MTRLAYWRRVARAYLLPGTSQLSFWHETPEAHPGASFGELRPQYYMRFGGKAGYAGPFDAAGVPQLEYHGTIGRRYNPIAVAQYGLACANRYAETSDDRWLDRSLVQAEWLVERLEPNARGVAVWSHDFDWEYRDTLRAPWQSGLAQGQGLSLLARAFLLTQDRPYREAADRAFEALRRDVADGGVLARDERGQVWIEEYLVRPPSHILNGFIWALWGVHDYALLTGSSEARGLVEACAATLKANLHRYDTGYWSLYELSDTRIPMLASPFYHRLHCVQLRLLSRLTGDPAFAGTAERWEAYAARRANRVASVVVKGVFKALYY